MRNKWGLGLMLLAMLATPLLACGFPLPAGTSMMAISKAVCAEGESAESCQVRQDAYQMMGKLQAATINDLTMTLYVNDGSQETSAEVAGSFDYVVSESSEYLGANVHARLGDATVVSGLGTNDLSNAEFMIVDDVGYTSYDGGETWVEEALEPTALFGLSFMLGLSGTQGASLDLFSDPGIFSVTAGEPAELNGQAMIVQTLTVNLEAMLSNPDVITSLLEEASTMGLEEQGLDVSELGDPAQVAMMAAMLLPFLEGSAFSTTIWIGAEDGYIHFIDESYIFMMDMTAMDPTTPPIEMTYLLSGAITDHNNTALVIEAPTDATEGEGGLLGGSGLGGSLFGN